MLLQDLFNSLPVYVEDIPVDVAVVGITDDSRQVQPGYVFVAVPGLTVDGHVFIPQAVAAGAVAVVGERPLAAPLSVPYALVPDARETLGWLHAACQGFPARQMTLIGVTGTDGKTTTTNLLYAILRAAGLKAGMVSTVNAQIGDASYDTGLHTTTPHADAVQQYLAQMAQAGTTHAVLETTSHGLVQQRLAGCDFDVAVITNITHEHLDYHGSWEAYREAKGMLFRGLAAAVRKPGIPKIAVLNADDSGSYDYLRAIAVEQQYAYGVAREDVDVTARAVRHAPQGLRFVLEGGWGELEVSSPLVGDYNVSNILAAATAALALGASPEAVSAGIAAVTGVPGRMERIDEGQAFTAIVDFAHTPNALQRALEAARQLAAPGGRVITVFGCAGLRDRQKRRMMGEVAAAQADITVITAEDPRTESLAAIMAETAQALVDGGRREGESFWRVPDRGQALRHAARLARPGDVVITCGKGHEQSMCFGEEEYPWDDREALRLALRGDFLATLPTASPQEESSV